MNKACKKKGMRENDDTAWEKRGNEGQTGVEGGRRGESDRRGAVVCVWCVKISVQV